MRYFYRYIRGNLTTNALVLMRVDNVELKIFGSSRASLSWGIFSRA